VLCQSASRHCPWREASPLHIWKASYWALPRPPSFTRTVTPLTSQDCFSFLKWYGLLRSGPWRSLRPCNIPPKHQERCNIPPKHQERCNIPPKHQESNHLPAGPKRSLAKAMRICQPPLNSEQFRSYCMGPKKARKEWSKARGWWIRQITWRTLRIGVESCNIGWVCYTSAVNGLQSV